MTLNHSIIGKYYKISEVGRGLRAMFNLYEKREMERALDYVGDFENVGYLRARIIGHAVHLGTITRDEAARLKLSPK